MSFTQFRIALIILYITGARVNEIKDLTYDDLIAIPKTKRVVLLQKKQRTHRIIPITSKQLDFIKYIEKDIKILFKDFELMFLGASLKKKKQSNG